MKIIIDVNDKLFKKDVLNRFQDFFERVISDIATNMNEDTLNACGRYEMETATLLKSAFLCGDYKFESEVINDELFK